MSEANWKEHVSSKGLRYYSDIHQLVTTEKSGHSVAIASTLSKEVI